MADIRLIETGSGGDAVMVGPDIQIINGLQNMPYLGMFGGNIESVTKRVNPNEERFDWWGNELLFISNESLQFNSQLERALRDVALSTSGRLKIEEAVKSDLRFLNDFSTTTIQVAITNVDRIEIQIRIQEPSVLDSNEFIYIWDATRSELTQNT